MSWWYFLIKVQVVLDRVLDFISRRNCLACRQVYASRKNSCICLKCEKDLLFGIEKLSKKALPKDLGDNDFQIYFAVLYKDSAKKLMKKYKYKFPLLYRIWGQILASLSKNHIEDYYEAEELVLVTNIPSHANRVLRRGYCHTYLIAKEFANKLKLKFIPDLLIRKKDTQALFNKSLAEREKILCDAFEFNSKAKIKYQDLLNKKTKIILIDDISTSGRTFLEACKIIKGVLKNSKLIPLACTGNNL